MTTRTICVEPLSRVEGESALHLTIHGETVTQAQLKIFEPPRFFEKLLVGRFCTDAIDITARICGICPAAHQMSAVHALERGLGLHIDPSVRALRRLLYCGEWIESHGLHIFLLHLPDFLGFEDALAMGQEHADVLKTGLRLKQVGNTLMSVLGGREVHPINARLGGFYRTPQPAALKGLMPDLKSAIDDAVRLLDWAATLDFPEFEVDLPLVALCPGSEYPMNEGDIASTDNIACAQEDFSSLITETHEAHSTALFSHFAAGGAYLVGPMARFALNQDRLTPIAAEAANRLGLYETYRNPFRSLLVRMVEILVALEEAVRLIEQYEPPTQPYTSADMRGMTGAAVTEAPRGLLYHRYEVGEDGRILSCNIIPPTSQNQASMERDVKAVAQQHVNDHEDVLKWRCEQAVRNYDPCISCAAHFLTADIARRDSF